MRRKLKQISNLSAHSRRDGGLKGRPDAKGERELRAERGRLEGEEVDDDNYDYDDVDVRPWVVFELRAPVVQTGNGSRRMAGMI